MIKALAIIGIIGGMLCAVADLLLDLKGVDNQKLIDSFAGVVSAMIGIGANESIKTGASYDLAKAIDTLR